MFRISRRVGIFIIIALAALGYTAVRLWAYSGGIPEGFAEARLQGAVIAQNVVNLSNDSVSELEKIDELDKKGDYMQALDLTTKVVSRSREIREQAVLLSQQVEAMTKSLSGIRSVEARQAALESIANRLALISRLINYSGYLGQLLETLRGRFNGVYVSSEDVSAIVAQINAEVRAINNFNSQAGQAMDRFDKIVEGTE